MKGRAIKCVYVDYARFYADVRVNRLGDGWLIGWAIKKAPGGAMVII